MALNGMNSNLVSFRKAVDDEDEADSLFGPKKIKKKNMFDDDDDDHDHDDEFEMFDDDPDFERMRTPEPNDPNEVVGQAWGGEAYSLNKEKKPNAAAKIPVADQVSISRPNHLQRQAKPDEFKPFQMRDNLNKTKFTETSQVVQKSTFTTEESAGTKTTTTRYEATTSSIENVVQKSKSEMTDAERNRMQAEIKELQKTVSNLRQQHKKAPLPEDTVRKLMLNQPCALELYKSLDDKLALLDEAVKLGDGDALITVLLFFKKTVKSNIFIKEIRRRPVAINHMIHFMKAHYEYDELIKLLRVLGRKEEAMMLDYKRAVTSTNADSQIQAIDTCQRIYETTPDLADKVSVLKEHQSLLKRQVKIEIKDKRSQAEGKDQMMRLHPPKSITSSPLIETLHYCCVYHYGKDDETLGPLSLQKEFKLTDKQFEWTMIGARAVLKKWGDLDAIFTSKSWYGSNKQKSNLGFDKVVEILEKSNAPPDVLSKYLALIENLEIRLSLATKLKCHKVAVETIVSMKDKQKLEGYRKNLDRTHPVQAVITRYLQNSQMKWK